MRLRLIHTNSCIVYLCRRGNLLDYIQKFAIKSIQKALCSQFVTYIDPKASILTVKYLCTLKHWYKDLLRQLISAVGVSLIIKDLQNTLFIRKGCICSTTECRPNWMSIHCQTLKEKIGSSGDIAEISHCFIHVQLSYLMVALCNFLCLDIAY